MQKFDYNKTKFTQSIADIANLPTDSVAEVAFIGRSNVGKSSALNAICGVNGLARASKTPGRTQLINFFHVEQNRFLVDLPGYGYAKVPVKVKQHWQRMLTQYLEIRGSLQGIILLIDIRHPLKELDRQMIEWCQYYDIKLHILLTKADKLKFGAAKQALLKLQRELQSLPKAILISEQLFSAQAKQGVDSAREKITKWLLHT